MPIWKEGQPGEEQGVRAYQSATVTPYGQGVDTITARQTAIAFVATKSQNISGATGFSTDTYLTNSNIKFPTPPKVGTTYKLLFDVTKTAAGTATPILTIRLGTAGAIADTARCVLTFGAGTAAVDVGLLEAICTFKTVGATTLAVLVAMSRWTTNLTTTGLTNAQKVALSTSAGFDSTVKDLIIGASYNGGASAAHTITLVRAEVII